MTDDRRLTVQGQERKEQLLDCAAVLFAERGYAETRVLDIVRAAGVAKGLFYWYFENKEALFRELVEQNRHRLRKAQADAIDPDAEALLQIRQGADASLRFMSRYAHFFALLEVENADRTFTEERRKGTELHTRDVARLIRAGIAAPAYATALSFFDGYRSAVLPANLIQAQRDYFGAHTYERTDKPRGEFFHHNWTGRGGTTTARTYQA